VLISKQLGRHADASEPCIHHTHTTHNAQDS